MLACSARGVSLPPAPPVRCRAPRAALRVAAASQPRCSAARRRPLAGRAAAARRRCVLAAAGDEGDKRTKEAEPERDEDGLYIGTYSNFFSDPAQIKGVIIFCGVLASFFSLGNIGAALLLPVLYDKPIEWCAQAIIFGYPC